MLQGFRRPRASYHAFTLLPRHLAEIAAFLLLTAFALILWPTSRYYLGQGYAYSRLRVSNLALELQPSQPKSYALYHGLHDCEAARRHEASDFWSNNGSPSAVDLCDGETARRLIRHLGQPLTECEGFPAPFLGLHDTLGTSSKTCLDRLARFAPYGLGDSWFGEPAWEAVDLAKHQRTCARTARRLATTVAPGNGTAIDHFDVRRSRTAIVLRAWEGFNWTSDDLHNLRALCTELPLSSGGDFQVFVLFDVHNASAVIPLEGDALEELKSRYVPESAVGMTELWNAQACEDAYPAVGEFNVYYHCLMPVQLFAMQHPEFDYVWNWEMDVRYTGDYSKLFPSLSQWAKRQPSEHLEQRNAKFYIQSYHGSYDNFTQSVGPGADSARTEPEDGLQDGSEADLITLYPIFNPTNTLWPHRNYVWGYNESELARLHPRYGTVGANMRFSRRLLQLMHEENQAGKAMMCEMFPPTLAVHHGFKAVYVPHPIFFEQEWTPQKLERTFNAREDSLNAVILHEKHFRGASWFYNAEYALELYRRWMGLATEGPGSTEWESEHGMMCLPNMLLHPVKTSHLHT